MEKKEKNSEECEKTFSWGKTVRNLYMPNSQWCDLKTITDKHNTVLYTNTFALTDICMDLPKCKIAHSPESIDNIEKYENWGKNMLMRLQSWFPQ